MVFYVHKINIQFMHWAGWCFLKGYYMKKDDILDILAAVFTGLMLAFFLFYRG